MLSENFSNKNTSLQCFFIIFYISKSHEIVEYFSEGINQTVAKSIAPDSMWNWECDSQQKIYDLRKKISTARSTSVFHIFRYIRKPQLETLGYRKRRVVGSMFESVLRSEKSQYYSKSGTRTL